MTKDMVTRGIWGKVITKGESLIVNSPAAHPDGVGVPEGHPQLTAFLGVPLKHGGETFGMIALANKESGYDTNDQEAVEALSVSFVEALTHKGKDEELVEHREHLEKEVAHKTRELEVANARLRKA